MKDTIKYLILLFAVWLFFLSLIQEHQRGQHLAHMIDYNGLLPQDYAEARRMLGFRFS